MFRSSDAPINATLNRWLCAMLRLLVPDRGQSETIVAIYDDIAIQPIPSPSPQIILNASNHNTVTITASGQRGHVTVHDKLGSPVGDTAIGPGPGVVDVEIGGRCTIHWSPPE